MFTEYFCVIYNYNKDIRAYINEQIIILHCGAIKSNKDGLIFFLYCGHHLQLGFNWKTHIFIYIYLGTHTLYYMLLYLLIFNFFFFYKQTLQIPL